MPTRYEVGDSSITQVVDHRGHPGVVRPLVADPLYDRGIVETVVHERWADGGRELRTGEQNEPFPVVP